METPIAVFRVHNMHSNPLFSMSIHTQLFLFICGCHRSCFWIKSDCCWLAAIAPWKRTTSRCDLVVVELKVKDLGTYNSTPYWLVISFFIKWYERCHYKPLQTSESSTIINVILTSTMIGFDRMVTMLGYAIISATGSKTERVNV